MDCTLNFSAKLAPAHVDKDDNCHAMNTRCAF